MSTALPMPLTRFVGREAELAEARALLADARMLTLIGPGGAGKTRLAIRLASDLGERFPDGCWFIDLARLAGGEFVWDEVAITIGLTGSPRGSALPDTVGRYLAGRRALMVLDNCEHVIAAASDVAATVIASAPNVIVIATSREPLGVAGEVTWTVPPMGEKDAVELFTYRARQAWPSFHVRAEDREAMRYICGRLDGLPLAIELAAARTRALDPAHIAAGLRDRFALLANGPRTAPARQATLAASFDWSYDLLTDAERALLRQLSVFAGGFDVEAALAVCPAASLELLAALTDRSLIAVERRSEGAGPRYRLLETVRQFAAEHLDEAGEVDLIRTRHRDVYLRLAETAEPELMGPNEDVWRERLHNDQDNIRAAMAWSRDRGEVVALARMALALAYYWAWPGRIYELATWMEAAARGIGDLPPHLGARLRNFQSMNAISGSGSIAGVPALAQEALELAREAGDTDEEALALCTLSFVAGLTGGADAMRPYLEVARELLRSAKPAPGAVIVLAAYAGLRLFQSDPEEYVGAADEAVALATAHLDRHTRLFATGGAGYARLVQGQLPEAAALFESNVAAGRKTNDSNFIGALMALGFVAMFRGDFTAARAFVAESLAAILPGSDSVSVTSLPHIARWVLGWIELADGSPARAVPDLEAVARAASGSMFRAWASAPLVTLAQAHLELGEQDATEAILDEAGSLARAANLTWVLGRVDLMRSRLRAAQGDLSAAETLAYQALRQAQNAGDRLGLVDGMEVLGRLAIEQRGAKEAVRLWAAADSLRSKLGYARFPIDEPRHDEAIARAKKALGLDAFAATWAEGEKLSPGDVIAYASRARGERRRPATGWASLTPTELEVVRLVCQHLSNPQIAAKMFVSRATVKTHLVHIFSKLGMDSRSQLVAEGLRRSIQAEPSGN